MPNIRRSVRLWITAALLLEAFVVLHTLHRGETLVARRTVAELPYSLGSWRGQEQPLQERIVQAIGVSDYVNRIYIDPAEVHIQLYVGYYASQKTGDSIHSPKNCMPGAGWEPIFSGYVSIPVEQGRRIVVNEYVIQQDLHKQMVFYWYQSEGRVIASEYAAKFWMVADAISRNRTDGALVRIVTPLNDGEANARARLTHFTQVLFPHLDRILPS